MSTYIFERKQAEKRSFIGLSTDGILSFFILKPVVFLENSQSYTHYG